MGRASISPPGYLSKSEAAERLGMSVKTLDRRRMTEPTFGRELRKGRQVFLSVQGVEAYARLSRERGYL